MKRLFLSVILIWCFGIGVWALTVTITQVSYPERIRSYLDEYDTAASLIQYLTSQQMDSHCKVDLLDAGYREEYGMICVLNNVFDGSWHLFVEIGDYTRVDKKTIVIMRGETVIHHQNRFGNDASQLMVGLIPHIERSLGEYTVHMSITIDGEESHVTWLFHTDDFTMGEE